MEDNSAYEFIDFGFSRGELRGDGEHSYGPEEQQEYRQCQPTGVHDPSSPSTITAAGSSLPLLAMAKSTRATRETTPCMA